MSLRLALLMQRLNIADIDADPIQIVFSPKEFIEALENQKHLAIIFDDIRPIEKKQVIILDERGIIKK